MCCLLFLNSKIHEINTHSLLILEIWEFQGSLLLYTSDFYHFMLWYVTIYQNCLDPVLWNFNAQIYASDEGRVQMTAAAFAKGFLALEGELTPILVQMVKSGTHTNGLLDNADEAQPLQTQWVWQYDSMTVWQCDSMTVWQCDSMTLWQYDSMTAQ